MPRKLLGVGARAVPVGQGVVLGGALRRRRTATVPTARRGGGEGGRASASFFTCFGLGGTIDVGEFARTARAAPRLFRHREVVCSAARNATFITGTRIQYR